MRGRLRIATRAFRPCRRSNANACRSRFRSFRASSESDALALLRPGIDGIALEYLGASATFLPQVWESLPEPGPFLEHLRRKAGLPGRFWHPDVRLSRYTVEKFL